jgi:hypothetical protein
MNQKERDELIEEMAASLQARFDADMETAGWVKCGGAVCDKRDCDCGAEKCNLPHSDWCTTNK